MANRHVQRMQATYATLDWLARRLASLGPYNLSSWVDLAGPADLVHPNNPNSASFLRRRQDEAARVLREVLNGGAARADLTVYPHPVNSFVKFNLARYKNKLSQAF